MGSGHSGLYQGTRGSSQAFAPFYDVMPDMREQDIKSGVIREGSYRKNPTAKEIGKMISGNYVGNKNTNGLFTYVIDKNGKIIVGKRNGEGKGPNAKPTPHPTLIGGEKPQVQCAGMLDIRGGKIFSFDNRSGHFKPNEKSLEIAKAIFSKLPPNLFHKRYNGGEK